MERSSKLVHKNKKNKKNTTKMKKKLRVLFVSEYFTPFSKGGGEISCSLLAWNLAKENVEVHVLTSHNEKDITSVETKNGVIIHRLLSTGKSPQNFLSNLRRIFFLGTSIRKEATKLHAKYHFNIIHYFNTNSVDGFMHHPGTKQIAHLNSPVFFSPTGILYAGKEQMQSMPFSFLRTVNTCLSAREIGKMPNEWYLRYNPLVWISLHHLYKKRLAQLQKVSHFTATTPFMVKLLHATIGTKKKSVIVPNIIESNKVNPKEKKKIGPLSIAYFGSFVEYKGVFTLLRALTDISIPYECTFFGSGPKKERMQQVIDEKHLSATIHSPVAKKNLNKTFQKQDVIVFPSLVSESFGRIAIEAMMNRVPVIATRAGGIADLVVHKKTGLLFTPGNAEELACSIEELAKNKKLRENLVNNGFLESKKYSGNIVAQTMKKFYRKLVNMKASKLR